MIQPNQKRLLLTWDSLWPSSRIWAHRNGSTVLLLEGWMPASSVMSLSIIFWHLPGSRKPKSFILIARYQLPVVFTLEGPILALSFMIPAVGLASSRWPGPYSPCGKEHAQNPKGLSAKLFSRSSPRSISSWPGRSDLKLDVLTEHPQGLRSSQCPFFSSHRKLTNRGKTKLFLHLIPHKHLHSLVIIRALS